MCGLAGLLGESLNQNVSYELITKAFEKAEIRGTDAAGFWGSNRSGTVIYHKEPIKSSNLVNTNVWQKIKSFSPNILLAHARQTTPGVGEASINRNNHPFINCYRTLGLIHNGRIPEFDVLKHKFQVLSDCDSEILLRIMESSCNTYTPQDINSLFPSLTVEVGYRLAGIMDIFSMINHGHMAVAVGEITPDGTKHLWLFRNKHRSLWLVDLRKTLGQIFFCSTPEIWQEAIQLSNRHLLGRQKLIEIPPEEVWHFQIDTQNPHAKGVRRFSVEREGEVEEWVDDGRPCLVQQGQPSVDVITNLNERDELPVKKELTHANVYQRCQEITHVAGSISTKVYNLIHENSLTDQEHQDLLDSLSQTKYELDGTLRLLDK